jgi:hypothetical protein
MLKRGPRAALLAGVVLLAVSGCTRLEVSSSEIAGTWSSSTTPAKLVLEADGKCEAEDVPLTVLKNNHSAALEAAAASTSCTWSMTDSIGDNRASNGDPFVWLDYPKNSEGLNATELLVRQDSAGLVLFWWIGDPDSGGAFEFRK